MFFDQPEAKLLVVYVKECITREKVAHERLGKEIRVGHWVAWLLVRTMWPRSKIKAFKMYSIFKQYWNEDQEDRLFSILYPTEWPIALPKQARIRLQTIRQLQKWQSKLQDPEIRDALQRKRIDGNWYEKRMATDIMERLESDDRDEKIQDYMESLAKQGLPEPKQTKKRTAPPDVQASPQRKRRIRSGLATPQTTPPQPSPGYSQLDGANRVWTPASGPYQQHVQTARGVGGEYGNSKARDPRASGLHERANKAAPADAGNVQRHAATHEGHEDIYHGCSL